MDKKEYKRLMQKFYDWVWDNDVDIQNLSDDQLMEMIKYVDHYK